MCSARDRSGFLLPQAQWMTASRKVRLFPEQRWRPDRIDHNAASRRRESFRYKGADLGGETGVWPGGSSQADMGRGDPPALVGAQPDMALPARSSSAPTRWNSVLAVAMSRP